jgi:glutathione synthase/RimK-type ligase-like ATP-grasp enzyme
VAVGSSGGFSDELTAAERAFAEKEAYLALNALTTTCNCLWVNHPDRERRAASKPAQLFVARQVGLQIPPTVITNDPEEVRSFIDRSTLETVYKALSQPRNLDGHKVLFTGLVTEERKAELDLIRITPAIFQQRVPKAYELRVTVVGQKIFAVKIDSQLRHESKLDWRRALHQVEYEPLCLPTEIEQKVYAFMHNFGLVYGALDFVVTPDGDHVFLEVNPSGAYMWVEAATGLEITSALADVLGGACPS